MRNSLLIAMAGVLVAAMTAGCGSSPADDRQTVELTDDLGRTVAVRAPARRIVTMAPNLTEITFAAGAGDRLVGVTTADNFPPEVDSLPRFSAVGVDFEAVAGLAPDIVLATEQVNSPQDAATFETLGIPIYYFSFGTLEDIFEGIKTVGVIAGTTERANEHAITLAAAVDELRQRTTASSSRPTVLFLIGEDRLFGFGKGSYVHEMIAVAGGTSVSSMMEVRAPVFSDEYVIREAPEVILGSFPPEVDARRILDLHPAWKSVPAIREERIYPINGDLVLRPGPRVVEGVYRMALVLQPDLLNADPSVIREE